MLAICACFNNLKQKRHLSALEKQSVWHGLSHRLPCSAPPAVMLPIPPTPAHSCLRAFELALLTAVLSPHRAIWCSLSSGLGLAASFSAEPTLPACPPPLPSSVALSPLNVLCISQVHFVHCWSLPNTSVLGAGILLYFCVLGFNNARREINTR